MQSYEEILASAPVSVGAVVLAVGAALVLLVGGVTFALIGFGHAGLAVTDAALGRTVIIWGGMCVVICGPLLYFAARRRSLLLLLLSACMPLGLALVSVFLLLRFGQ